MKRKVNNTKWIVLLCVVFLVSLWCCGCSERRPQVVTFSDRDELHDLPVSVMTEETPGSEEQEPASERETELPMIAVHVCGEVRSPGVYFLSEDSRVCDAVDAAGGFSEGADTEWINLAGVLQDGAQLRIPTKEEVLALRSQSMSSLADMSDTSGHLSGTASEAGDERVDLNTASLQELMTLPGVGEAKAQAILDYREQYGSFQSVEELKNISGIKEAVFAKIKDRVTV